MSHKDGSGVAPESLSPPPPEDAYPVLLEEAIQALLGRGREAGAKGLAPIAYSRREVDKRRALTRELQGRVYCRDRFTCRYWGRPCVS